MRAPKTKALFTLTSLGLICGLSFQNCGAAMNFVGTTNGGISNAASTTTTTTPSTPITPVDLPPPTVTVCEGISCSLTPLTNKPAVMTILIALGDEADDQLVVKGQSAQLIAESIVRYTSPKARPKILLVHDFDSASESPKDYGYMAKILSRYDVTTKNEPGGGLTANDIAGFDIVWLDNPGYPAHSKATRDVLMAFAGGVVIQGDDMSQGSGFDMSPLTGLKFIDNGTSVVCKNKSYNTDNNLGAQFSVSIADGKMSTTDTDALSFLYGNDIDNTTPARSDLEILASAKGNPKDCTETRPAIVRYVKNSAI